MFVSCIVLGGGCKRSQHSYSGPPDHRHTYASLMLRRGVPIAYVSKQLGHSSIQITVDLYGHFIPGADRHHVEGLAEAIEEPGRQLDATQPQPDPITKNHTDP